MTPPDLQKAHDRIMQNTSSKSRLTLDPLSIFEFDSTRPYGWVPESEFRRFDNPDYAYEHGPTGAVFLVHWNADRARAGVPCLRGMSAALVKTGRDGVPPAPGTLYSLARSSILVHRALLRRRAAEGTTSRRIGAMNDNCRS